MTWRCASCGKWSRLAIAHIESRVLWAQPLSYCCEIFLTQALQIIAGSKAGSRWMSGDVYKRAARKDKNLHIVEGASHVGLCDKADLVAEAMSKLAPFFRKNLTKTESHLAGNA